MYDKLLYSNRFSGILNSNTCYENFTGFFNVYTHTSGFALRNSLMESDTMYYKVLYSNGFSSILIQICVTRITRLLKCSESRVGLSPTLKFVEAKAVYKKLIYSNRFSRILNSNTYENFTGFLNVYTHTSSPLCVGRPMM